MNEVVSSGSYNKGEIMAKINNVVNVNAASTYNAPSSQVNSDDSSDFSSYLGESKSLDKIFDQAAEKYNVPVELLKAVGKAESNFRADALSRCGAQGIMQLMPATAKGLGVKDAFDPEQNIMGGAKYISTLLKRYDGDTKLALAAYNAGSGNVAKYGGVPPFKETQNYIKKILGFIKQSGSDVITTNNTAADHNAATISEKNISNNVFQVAPADLPTAITTNYAYLLSGNAEESIDSVSDLDMVFSYDEYLNFIDHFLNDENNGNAKENTNKYNTKDIAYSSPVINLLVNKKL